MKIQEICDVTLARLPNLLRTILESGGCPIVLGPPGLGKSSAILQLGDAEGRPVIDQRAANLSPSDLLGVLAVQEGKARFIQPCDILPTKPGGLLFWDEFTNAPPVIMKCLLQVVLDGRCGPHTLPPDTWQVMAGNRLEDSCFIESLPASMWNRLVILRVKPDLDSWMKWAFGNKVGAQITSWLTFKPGALYDFIPDSWDGQSQFASPRAWDRLNRIMQTKGWASHSEDEKQSLIVGTVGSGAGIPFHGFLQLRANLPTFEEILKSPTKCPVPEEPSARTAVAAMIAEHLTPKNIGTAMKYAARLGVVMETFILKAAAAQNDALLVTPEVLEWIDKHPEVFA
ncbi:MAG: hypothetical protein ABFD94_18935 [Armatimonadia bacterium]